MVVNASAVICLEGLISGVMCQLANICKYWCTVVETLLMKYIDGLLEYQRDVLMTSQIGAAVHCESFFHCDDPQR